MALYCILLRTAPQIFFYLKLVHGTKWVTDLCYKIFLSHRGYGVRQDKRYMLHCKLGRAYVKDYAGYLKM